jgi:hypothetical protein
VNGRIPPVPKPDRTRKPSREQLVAAEAKGRTLKDATRVHVTEYGVWVDGAEYWVCPWDLSISKNWDLYARHYCRACGQAIAP